MDNLGHRSIDPGASDALRRNTLAQFEDREEDGISLFSLCSGLYERRRLILGVAAGFLILGVAFALGTSRSYSYTTSIEIGTRVADERSTPIEPIETVVAKIKESYIPIALRDSLGLHPNNAVGLSVDAIVPRGSHLVVLRSQGPIENTEAYAELHQGIVRYIAADHDHILSLIKNRLDIAIADATRKIGQLRDDTSVVQGKLSRLNQYESLLFKQIGAMTGLLTSAAEQRERAIREAKDEARAMTLLMLTEDIRQNRAQLLELERQAKVELPNNRDELLRRLRDNQRAEAEQARIVESLKLQAANLHETRSMGPTMRSLGPVGLSRTMLIGVSLILGLMAGMFVALLVQSYAAAKNRARMLHYLDAGASGLPTSSASSFVAEAQRASASTSARSL